MRVKAIKAQPVRNWLLTCAVALLLAACASTSTHKLIHTAKDPEWAGEPFARILVVGLSELKYRIPFEDTFSAELRRRGFDVIASYRSMPDAAALDSPEEVEDILTTTGADAVLTVSAKGFREANDEAWGTASSIAWYLIDDPFLRRDVRRVIGAGAAVDNLNAAHYGVEAELWNAANHWSVWVGRTDTYDAGELQEVLSTYADLVVDELSKNKLIKSSL
ncbi:MAG: hypothetical protein ABJL54_18815 [Halioglobus sp.]